MLTALFVIAGTGLSFLGPSLEQGSDRPVPSLPSTDDERPSIAVLPLDNIGDLDESVAFTNGIHDDILTHLYKIGDLKVISRTSVLEYRDPSRNPRQIADELGVATILEGGVQRSGDRVRINVQLIDAETDEHPWAETYEDDLTAENVFTVLRRTSAPTMARSEEVLKREIFYSLEEAKVLIEQWRREYNTIRPHSSLSYRPPAPAAIRPDPAFLNLPMLRGPHPRLQEAVGLTQ